MTTYDIAGLLYSLDDVTRVTDVRLMFQDGVVRTSITAPEGGLLMLNRCTVTIQGARS